MPFNCVQYNYLRVKREKTTIFLVCEMTETVDAAKAKLCSIVGSGQENPPLVSPPARILWVYCRCPGK